MPARERGRPGRALAACLAVWVVALGVHAAVALQYRHDPFARHYVSDALSYDVWARRIVRQGLAAEPVFHQAPLFPLALSALYRLSPEAQRGTAALGLQIVLMSTAIALLVPLGRLYFGGIAAGLAAAAIALLHGPFVFYGLKLLPVPLALATQAAALAALGAARGAGSVLWAIVAGSTLGLACLARAETLAFVPFAVLALWTGAPRPRRFAATAALALALAATVLPATAHNARRGDGVLIASALGENLFAGNQRRAEGGHKALAPLAGDIFSQRTAAQAEAERARGRALRPSEVSAYWRERAGREIAADPLGWLALEARKLGRILHPGDPTDMYSFALERSRYLTLLHALPLGVWSLILLGAAGAWLAWREGPRGAWPIGAFAAVQGAVLLVFFVDSRLRVPLLFSLVPFAGHAAAGGLRRWREGRGRRALAACGAALVLATLAGALALRPAPRDLVRLAAVLSLQQRVEEALAVLQPDLSGPRPDAYVLDEAGWLHQKLERFGESRELYERALAHGGLSPSRARHTRTRLGMVLERLGQPEAALAQHDAAVASGHATAGTYYERGMLLLRQGRTEDAVSDLRQAVRLDPRWLTPRDVLRSLGLDP
jgi:tetratricopeptide (TPR) repeat protein